MQKKKILIRFFIIIISILILSSIVAVIYMKTDLLKSDKQLFFKYLVEENQMLDMISLNQESDNSQKSFSSIGTVDYLYEYNNMKEIKNDQIGNNLKQKTKDLKNLSGLSGSIISSVDKKNKKATYQLELLKDEEDIMNFELVRDEDKYAFKSEQIVKDYVGIENNNINEFLKKMNIIDNEIVPSKINLEDIYQALSKFTPEEKEHIYETYKNIAIQSLDAKNYSKQKNKIININNSEYTTNVYTLTLTKTESLDLLIKILQTLKQDSITLNLISNKIKMINPDSDYIKITKLIEQIDFYIQELEKQEKSDSEFIRVDVYSDKKIVRKIDFCLENDKQISFEYEEQDGKQSLQITQKNITKEATSVVYNIKDALLNTKKLKIIKTSNSTSYQLVVYNIRDIYKNIIDDLQKNNNNDTEVNDESQYDLEEIQEIYNQYKDMKDEDVEISFNIDLYNEKEDKNRTEIYLLVCNSKARNRSNK